MKTLSCLLFAALLAACSSQGKEQAAATPASSSPAGDSVAARQKAARYRHHLDSMATRLEHEADSVADAQGR
jgi:hypothetical protein